MHAEGALKGILTSSSGRGWAFYGFAAGEAAELFEGFQLLAPFRQHNDLYVRMLMPKVEGRPILLLMPFLHGGHL
jgi:hypothetical protein